MATTEAMKRERCSLELKTLSGLVPCNPMTRDGKVPTPVTVRPYIGSEDDLTGCFLKKSSVICDSKNWSVTPTARSHFRVINHNFHMVTEVLFDVECPSLAGLLAAREADCGIHDIP